MKNIPLWFRLSAMTALCLVASFSVRVQAQETRPTLQNNILATITIKKGQATKAECGDTQAVQTVVIYSDGSGINSLRSRGTLCSQPGAGRTGMRLQGTLGFPATSFNVKSGELEHVKALLRARAGEALLRGKAQATGDTIDMISTAEEERSLSISLASDEVGSPFASELVRVTDTSPESVAIGATIVRELLTKTEQVLPTRNVTVVP